MLNPLFNKRHIREYLVYGLSAAIAFMIPALVFILSDNYTNSYYLYIGTALYMIVMFLYSYKLLYRKYDGKHATAMLISAHIANAVGVISSVILSVIACAIHFPGLFSDSNNQHLVGDTPPQIQSYAGADVLLMVLVVTLLGNGGAGSFISVVTTYAGKRNQTRDKPTPLETNIPEKRVRIHGT